MPAATWIFGLVGFLRLGVSNSFQKGTLKRSHASLIRKPLAWSQAHDDARSVDHTREGPDFFARSCEGPRLYLEIGWTQLFCMQLTGRSGDPLSPPLSCHG